MLSANDSVRAKVLLEKQLSEGVLTAAEQEELNELFETYSDEELAAVLSEIIADKNFATSTYTGYDWERVQQNILAQPQDSGVYKTFASIHRRSFYQLYVFRSIAAAVLLLIVGITVWLLLQRPFHEQQSAPCGLKLPSKEQEEDIVHITMVQDKITFSIPRSWQYRLTLPDGTEVWLNAASSITYPRNFTAANREVAIEGEVYFNIAGDRAAPFYVTTRGKRLAVPGRHFNINAYEEQAIVRIDTTRQEGWKEGYFAFKEAGVRSVVEEMARWYDWKVEYSSAVKPATVTALFCRNTSESGALQELRSQGIPVRKEGNKITVL